MTKLAQLIATKEGFYVPDSLPARDNNPGDLRHSPHSVHPPDEPDSIGVIDDPADGWADLERQLALYAARGLTIAQAITEYAPPTENDTQGYIDYLCNNLPCTHGTLVSEALKIT